MKYSLIILMTLLFSCSTGTLLDKDLLKMEPTELLEHSIKLYNIDDNSSSFNNDELVQITTQKIILDCLLFPKNINWEDLKFEDFGFKEKLKFRSEQLSRSEDFDWIQHSYRKIVSTKNESGKDLKSIIIQGKKESSCSGKSKEIKELEIVRLNKFSKLDFTIESIEYIGNCSYQVLSNVRDLTRMKDFQLKMTYTFDSSSNSFIVGEGDVLNEKNSLSEFDIENRLNDFIKNNRLIQGTLGMTLYDSTPEKGRYVYYGTICFGSSKYECENQSVYISTNDFGETWNVDF